MAVAVPISPPRLLAHARDLAQTGAGRPSATLLRRAISAAYYAIFHAVAFAIVKQLAPNASPEDRYNLCRSIDHTRLTDVCGWVASTKAAGKQHVQAIVSDLQKNPQIVQLAGIVHRLQEARHRADYDHLAGFDKVATLSIVQQAGRAVTTLDQLRNASDPDLERFLAVIALHTQLR